MTHHHNNFRLMAQRSTAFAAALAIVAAAVLPATSAFADALNPLTERSLTLSSSSPGWAYTDGSGNATYAPPNSGANGKQTGNTFSFKVSSPATVKAFTFQYCTAPAGDCTSPGNNSTHGTDTTSTSDLNVNFPSADELDAATTGAGTITVNNNSTAVEGDGTDFVNDLSVGDVITTAGNKSYKIASITDPENLVLEQKASGTESGVAYTYGDFTTVINTSTGDVKAIPGYAGYDNGKPGVDHQANIGGIAGDVAGNFVVYYNNGGTWTQSTGWSMTTSAVKTQSTAAPTDPKNYITLKNSSGQALAAGQAVKIVFFGTTNNYITNPGANMFFVRMNTYSDDNATTVIDGGVTVANVMNQSIWIQTKVLETMSFSVGTVDPNTLPSDDHSGNTVPSTLEKALFANTSGKTGLTKHGVCDNILGNITPDKAFNVLNLGNPTADNSLEVNTTFYTHSYWRLSSNSSAGATVYYSGHTLTNTVGDQIEAVGATAATPSKGSEQFGLGIVSATEPGDDAGELATNYAFINDTYDKETGNDTSYTSVHASTTSDLTGQGAWHTPTLYPLLPVSAYAAGTTQFAFVPTSDTVPVPIASESNEVVDCVTAKMRYMANIRATTPAGIYTTKVNYIASPQY